YQQPSTINLEAVKKEYHQAQTYLDFWYPKQGTCIRKNESIVHCDKCSNKVDNFNQTRKQITKLHISYKNLQGSLKLEGFVNLERLYCSSNQLTNLDFLNNLNPEKLT